MHLSRTSVPSAAGELAALVWRPRPASDRALPGIVLVEGSGERTATEGDRWPPVFTGCGAVVLTHDKPGCGTSPGDWREQTMHDRARESIAALEVLRAQPGVDPNRVGLLGISQGGWVVYLAAALAPEAVHQIAVISGPGISPAAQERYRLARAVGGDPRALAWIDERTRRLASGEDAAAVLAEQRAYQDEPWYAQACDVYDDLDLLSFVARNIAFDPADALRAIRCPVFAAFGAADALVPTAPCVTALNELLPSDPRHALAVFPGADHNLFTAAVDRTVPLAGQLAAGYLAMLTDWLAK